MIWELVTPENWRCKTQEYPTNHHVGSASKMLWIMFQGEVYRRGDTSPRAFLAFFSGSNFEYIYLSSSLKYV